jgi:hypothetical protein
MLVLVRKGWEMPEREATPEAVFRDRRRLLRGMGLGAAAVLLGGPQGAEPAAPPAAPSPAPARLRTDPWRLHVGGAVKQARTLEVNELARSPARTGCGS